MSKGSIIRIILFSICMIIYLNHAVTRFLYSTGFKQGTGVSSVIAAHQDREYHYTIDHPLVDRNNVRINYRIFTQEGFYVIQSRVNIKNIPVNAAIMQSALLMLPPDPRLQQALQIIKDAKQNTINASFEFTYDDKVRLAGIDGRFNVLGIEGHIMAYTDHIGLHRRITVPSIGIIEKSVADDFNTENVHGPALLLPAGLRSGQHFQVKPYDSTIDIEVGPQGTYEFGKQSVSANQSSVILNNKIEASLIHDNRGVIYSIELTSKPAKLILIKITDLAGETIWDRTTSSPEPLATDSK